MADNITAPAAGAVLATDEIGGVHYPRTKISFGVDGAVIDVSAGAPLPVVAALPNGASSAAKQDAILAALSTVVDGLAAVITAIGNTTYFPANQPVSGTVALDGASLAALETTELGAATLAALENTTVTVTDGATAAKQDIIIGHVDGIEAALASILAKIIAAPATAAKQDEMTAAINALVGNEYEAVGASTADQPLGATGAAGDLLVALLIVPLTTSPGAVSIKDGAGGAPIPIFTGGANSVSTLHPFVVAPNVKAGTRWLLTTGANVAVFATGNFT